MNLSTEHFLQAESIQHISLNNSSYPVSTAEFLTFFAKSVKSGITLDRFAIIALIYSFDFKDFINNNPEISTYRQISNEVLVSLILTRYFKKTFLQYLLDAGLLHLLPKLNLLFETLNLPLDSNDNTEFSKIVIKTTESAFLSSYTEVFPLKLPDESSKVFFNIQFNLLRIAKKINDLELDIHPSYLEQYCYAYTSFIFQFEKHFPDKQNPFLESFNSHNDEFLIIFYDIFSQLKNGFHGIRRIHRNHIYFQTLFQKPIMSALAFKKNHRFFLKQSYCNAELALTLAPQHFV